MIRTAKQYTNWCMENHIAAWPASFQSCGRYLCYKVKTLDGSAKSVNDIISGIKQISILGDSPWLSTTEELQLKKVKAILILDDPYPVNRKDPMLLIMIEELIKKLKVKSSPLDLLVICMALTSHNGLLRAKELLSGIQVEDCIWDFQSKRIDINIGPTKTHRVGCGVWVKLTAYDDRPCAYNYLYKWFTINKLWDNKKYYIFPYFYHRKNNREAYLEFRMKASTKWWEGKVNELGELLGKQKYQISKHSFRAGGCTDLFALGVSYAMIKSYGRWKSDAVLLYMRSDVLTSRTIANAFNRGTYDMSNRGLSGMGVFDDEDL